MCPVGTQVGGDCLAGTLDHHRLGTPFFGTRSGSTRSSELPPMPVLRGDETGGCRRAANRLVIGVTPSEPCQR